MCILKKIKMDSFEINKIITAILVTVLVVFGISKIADTIFEVKKPDVKGYKGSKIRVMVPKKCYSKLQI